MKKTTLLILTFIISLLISLPLASADSVQGPYWMQGHGPNRAAEILDQERTWRHHNEEIVLEDYYNRWDNYLEDLYPDDEYTYEMLDLDDPLALAVGYITKCCFLIDGLSKESLYHSISNKNGRTFIVRKNGELIAQSWAWRNGNVLCFDNVEARGNYSYDKLLETYQKASEELLEISDQTENETESLKVITYGTSESRMTKPSKRFTEKPLPKVLEPVGYSDAKYEQYILAGEEDKELYYGEVTARYQDPRPEIVEYRDIKSLEDKKIRKINQELDGIEYTATGKTRKNNIRKCTYVAYNKDWYIAITDNGKVEIQILKKDPRAIEECKSKAKIILKEIRKDKIVVPTDIEGIGGDDR